MLLSCKSILNMFTNSLHNLHVHTLKQACRIALPCKICMCFIHLPSNMAVCILKIFQKGGSDDFKCNFSKSCSQHIGIKGLFCQCVHAWLFLNIITRNKGRCIKHCNITHLVIGLFKQVWPSKPDGGGGANRPGRYS